MKGKERKGKYKVFMMMNIEKQKQKKIEKKSRGYSKR